MSEVHVKAIKPEYDQRDVRLMLAYLTVSFLALGIGIIAGVLQALDRTGLLRLPPGSIYYQLLTAHGIYLALVFTTYFIGGFLFAGVAKTLGGRLLPSVRKLGWVGFIGMTVGIIMVGIEVLANRGTVLYTFYAPMGAPPTFYIGLALLIVGSWLVGIGICYQYYKWRREHRGERSPLFAFMAVATFVMWFVASSSVAVEVLFQLIPWSLGWTDTINVHLSRMLFWLFGHPLVYFWLLPAYIVWYINLPKLMDGYVFSDSLARIAFLLLIIFSLPVGLHHEFMEPGVSAGWKYLQTILTMAVVFPSMMTAFAILGTMEQAGRKKGGKGLFGWVWKLPWKDARFLSIAIGMVSFIPVGASGIINASFQLNQVVHNTLFVTGHFHLALATTVTMTFFAAAYFLVPALTNRLFTPRMNRLGILQALTWGGGMTLMSVVMYIKGYLGEPRRISFTTYMDHPAVNEWLSSHLWMGIGGTLAFIGGVLFLVIVGMFFFSPRGKAEFPIAETVEGTEKTPAILERWSIWVPVMVFFILIAYTVPILSAIQEGPSQGIIPPFRTW